MYKVDPSAMELSSLTQCLGILNRWEIVLFGPQGLDCRKYEEVFERHNKKMIFQEFDKSFFSSITGYNKLMCSEPFYHRFLNYDFLLLYQLDAWVFRDELKSFLEMDYDFIGAPVFDLAESDLVYDGILNGGLSLRKIKSHYAIAKKFQKYYSILMFVSNFCCKRGMRFKSLILSKFQVFSKISENKNFLNFLNIECNEDVFWSSLVLSENINFRVPSFDQSLAFSFENHPTYLFQKNENKLPFGCHAWERYDKDFWGKFIPDIKLS